MKKDDDVKLSTERILFLFCILFYFFFLWREFSRWSIHSTPSTCRNFSFSFFPPGLCPAPCPNWVLYRNTYKPRFILYTYDVKQHSSFPFFQCLFIVIVCLFSFDIGKLENRSIINRSWPPRQLWGGGWILFCSTTQKNNENKGHLHTNSYQRVVGESCWLTISFSIDFSVFIIHHFFWFGLCCFFLQLFLSLFSSLSYCYDYVGAIWFSFTESFLTVWLFTHAAKTPSIDVDSLSLWNPPPLLVVSTCCTVVVQQKSWPEWPTTKFIWLYTLRSTTAALSLKLLQLVRIIAWR